MNNETLIDRLQHYAETRPDHLAFTFLADGETESGTLTYSQLNQSVQRVAAALEGVAKPGDRALLLFDSSLDFVKAFFGCLYAGVVAVPAYPPRYNRNLARVAAIMHDCEPGVVLTTRAFAQGMDDWRKGSETLHNTDWLAVDEISEVAVPAPRQRASETSLAFLQYTSGSTGAPKGVQVSHRNIMANEAQIQQSLSQTSEEIMVSWLPLFHDLGLIGVILNTVYLGSRCIFMPPEQFISAPMKWLKAITKYRATVSGGPNFAYELCSQKVSEAELRALDFSTWQVAFNGAEPIKAEVIRAFCKQFQPCGFDEKAFWTCYGMAETTLLVTSHRRGVATRTTAVDTASLSNNWVSPPSPGFPSQEFVSCGAPEREVEVVIVDVETLMECPNGKVGEIWVQSDSVAEGYWKKPEVNQEIFQAFTSSGRGPFLRTGDLGFLDAEGELHVTGRRKELIIINGQNYYPQDIERSVQTAHPGFRPGCGIAFSLVDGKGNEQLTVVQEVRKSLQDNLDGGKLFQHLTKVIMKDHGLALKRLVLLEAGKIPKTSSGKLQRAICKDRLNQDAIDYLMEIDVNSIHLRSSVAVAHETNQIRAWLIQWLSSSLSLPALEIRLSLPFYEYDWDYNRGHALSRAVYRKFAVNVDPLAFWSFPTISNFSEWLESNAQLGNEVKSGFQLANELSRSMGSQNFDEHPEAVAWASRVSEMLAECETAHRRKARILHELESLVRSQWVQGAARVIDRHSAFVSDLGMPPSSLTEFKHYLSSLLGHRLPATLFFDYPSINELADFLLKEWVQATHREEAGSECELDLASIEAMDLDEQQALLGQLING